MRRAAWGTERKHSFNFCLYFQILCCSFWKFSEKGASRLPFERKYLNTLQKNINNNKYTQRSVNCKFGLQSNLIFRVKPTRTTSIEKYFTTRILINLVKDAIVERRLFS